MKRRRQLPPKSRFDDAVRYMVTSAGRVGKLYAERQGLADEWRDVMELIEGQGSKASGNLGGRLSGGATLSAMVSAASGAEPARLWCGDWTVRATFTLRRMRVAWCAYLARWQSSWGFMVVRIQTEFPDCEAIRLVGKDRYLSRLKIEFEYESRNFLKHNHDPEMCDLIYCAGSTIGRSVRWRWWELGKALPIMPKLPKNRRN